MVDQVSGTPPFDSTSPSATTEQPESGPREPTTTERFSRIGLALAVAFAIVASAWFVGERQGWTEIGQGGKNSVLLPKIGDRAPELFTLSTDGEPVLLSRLQGQPVWINFWGSWCPPCRAEMPDVQRAYDTLAPQGVQVLSISMQESPEDALRYRDSVGATFPVYVDPTRIAGMIDATQQPELAQQLALMTRDWQIANFPTHVFIGPDGIVKDIVLSQMTYEEAVERGEALLQTANNLMPPVLIRQIA
jgi:peroxiredoxin